MLAWLSRVWGYPKLRYQWFLCLFSPMRRVLVTAGEPVQRGAGVEWDSSPAILDLPIYPTPFPFCPALLGRRDEQTPQPSPCCGVKAWLTQDQAASFPSAFWLDGRLGRHLFLKKRLWNVCYSLELQRKEAGLGYVPEASWRGGNSANWFRVWPQLGSQQDHSWWELAPCSTARGMGCSLHLSPIYLGKVALWTFESIWGFREY